MNKEQGTRNKEQGTRNKEQGTRNKEQGTTILAFSSSKPSQTFTRAHFGHTLMAALLISGLTFTSPLMAETPEEEYLTDENSETAELIDKVQEVEKLIYEVQSQFQCLTNSLSSILSPLPDDVNKIVSLLFSEGSTSVPMTLSDNAITIRNDAKIYYGDMELEEYLEKKLQSSSLSSQQCNESNGASLAYVQQPSTPSTPYPTTAEFNSLKQRVASLESNLSSLKKSLSSLNSDYSSLKTSVSNLSDNFKELENYLESNAHSFCSSETGASIIVGPCLPNPDDSIVPNRFLNAQLSNWNKVASSFTPNKAATLQGITLYCGNKKDLIKASQVYVTDDSACQINYASSMTQNGNYCLYKFSTPVHLEANHRYYLVLKGQVVPYVCPRYRGEGIYKPVGANEVEINSTAAISSNFLELSFAFSGDEIWSQLHFEGASFDFTKDGLNVSDGTIKIDGSKVVTESGLRTSLNNMSGSPLVTEASLASAIYKLDNLELKGAKVITEYDMVGQIFEMLDNGIFEGEIEYDMLSPATQKKLITTAGGQKINGNLELTGQATVNGLVIKGTGDWKVGSSSNMRSLVICHPNALIKSESGNLNLKAADGKDIVSHSFLQIDDSAQSGIVEIEPEKSFVTKIVSGLTSEAIVLLTPMQKTDAQYWLEIDGINHSFTVHCSESEECHSGYKFTYLVVRK